MLRYTVQPGDTVQRIANRCRIQADSLYAANPQISRAQHLARGLVLSIPAAVPQLYVLQQGDSLNELARRFGVSAAQLLLCNPHLNPMRLMPGQLLTLPFVSACRFVDPNEEYGPRELYADLNQLASAYSHVQVGMIGRSVLGRPLPCIRIGDGQKRLHVNASFHANEWITSLLAMTFVEDYARAIAQGEPLRGVDARGLASRVQLWIVPMVNPDGVEIAQEGISPGHPFYAELLRWNRHSHRFFRWKANIRGVDLNDQFPAHWDEECARRGTEGPSPRDYPGSSPLSEPEAAAMAAHTNQMDFDLAIALHTQGQEIYWNYRDYEPSEAEPLASRLGMASGYRPVKLSGSDAGFKDWFIQEYRKPGFTIEAGIGVNPLPLAQFADLYDEVAPLLLEAMQSL
jgi:g-D-glutamyl-meso-diaminopimelate peptidase